MSVVKTFVRAGWLAALLLPALSWAQDTDEAPVGETVERHLSLDNPMTRWVQDPTRDEEEVGDTIEMRETLTDALETIKLSGLVPPVRFESGVADIPDTTVESLAAQAQSRRLADALIGVEIGGGREWLGELHLIAIYDRALDAGEVQQNFTAGP